MAMTQKKFQEEQEKKLDLTEEHMEIVEQAVITSGLTVIAPTMAGLISVDDFLTLQKILMMSMINITRSM